MSEADLSTFDLRYESYRMRTPALEARLLASIMERGIEEALEGVDVEGRRVLLNGFKRYRCARKLGLSTVPYVSLGDDAASGIIAVLRASNHKRLSILEEARLAQFPGLGPLGPGLSAGNARSPEGHGDRA